MKLALNKINPLLRLAMLGAVLLYGCGDQPLFDELATNRLRIVIKGTFESNAPAPWNSTEFPDPNDPLMEDDSVNDVVSPADDNTPPSVFHIDVAELQVGKKKIGEYRQLYTASISDTDPFFDGTGLIMRNDDPPEESFNNVRMFIRKMIFDGATQYYLDYFPGPGGGENWILGDVVQTIFHEKAVEGFNFNLLQVNSYYDSLLLQADDINRIFPLSIPIDGGFVYDRHEEETVLEIRLVIKNFVKKYEYDYYDEDGRHAIYHYFGLSDWLRDVKADESAVGGNVHAVARVYVPGKTATISDPGVTAAGYIVAIPVDKDIDDYFPNMSRVRPLYDGGNTERYAEPTVPYLPAAYSVDSILDYYLKYEQYRVEYNLFVNGVEDTGTADGNDYESEWTAYEDGVTLYKLPPLVTYSNGTGYTITNVPIGGTYKLFFAPSGSYGTLPDFGSFVGPYPNASGILVNTNVTVDIP